MPERIARRCLAALALALVLAAPPDTAARAAASSVPRRPATTPIAYAPHIDGLTQYESDLHDVMRESGVSFRLENTPPETIDGLRRRAMQDVDRFHQILDSFGFYDGKVSFRIGNAKDGEPRPLVFTVDTGPVYLLGDVLVRRGADAKPVSASAALLDTLGLHIGMQARAQAVIDAENKLITDLQDNGYPFVEALDRRTVINPDNKTMTVTYRIDVGKKATYGPAHVVGLDRVKERYVLKYLRWKQGKLYDHRQLDRTRDDLAATDLFQSVDIAPVKPVGANGQVPIKITVKERPPRSIGVGVNYSTDVGPGAQAFWENRNLLGQGERLRIAVTGSSIEQGVEGTFRKPLFRSRSQDLIADGQLKNKTTDAYNERTGSAFVGLERKIGPRWRISLGPTMQYSDVTNTDSAEGSFLLGGLRGRATHSSVKDPLNPTQGAKIDLEVTPYTSLDSRRLRFFKTSAAGSAYYGLGKQRHYVLAGRAKVGSIIGGDRQQLPASMRFYAGGGGSVRGYDFQSVGPLNGDNSPVGGKSLIDLSVEFRARVTDKIGIVPFVDGGNVFRHEVPQSVKLLWAAGIGLRYYTAVGPLRADVAFPLDRRKGVDGAFQLYFSLGQSF